MHKLPRLSEAESLNIERIKFDHLTFDCAVAGAAVVLLLLMSLLLLMMLQQVVSRLDFFSTLLLFVGRRFFGSDSNSGPSARLRKIDLKFFKCFFFFNNLRGERERARERESERGDVFFD